MMRARLLSPREGGVLGRAFVLVAALLVLTAVHQQRSGLAALRAISGRLSEEPVSRWIAPEWWGFWPETHMTGLFREHPAGVFLVPVALGRARHSRRAGGVHRRASARDSRRCC